MIDTINISHLNRFLINIKKESLTAFVISFIDKEECDQINSNIINLDEVRWVSSRYFEWNADGLSIKKHNLEKCVKEVYKYIVYKALNLQVDKGKLELCWDKKKKEFFWRHPIKKENR